MCLKVYIGETCETYQDKCQSSPCKNNALCFQAENSRGFECKCFPPFSGDDCGLFLNPCAESNLCGSNGACVPQSNGGYSCTCMPDYTGTNYVYFHSTVFPRSISHFFSKK